MSALGQARLVRLDRRNLVWINVTTNPTAEWIARQITEAFPWSEAPRYLIRDRDCIYGTIVTRRLHAMGIRDKPIAPTSLWQNGFAERLIGSIRRECLDHLVVLSEAPYVGSCKPMPAITTKSEHIDHWTKMHQSRGQFSGSETSRHMYFSGACIANMSEFEFSVHTRVGIKAMRREWLVSIGAMVLAPASITTCICCCWRYGTLTLLATDYFGL